MGGNPQMLGGLPGSGNDEEKQKAYENLASKLSPEQIAALKKNPMFGGLSTHQAKTEVTARLRKIEEATVLYYAEKKRLPDGIRELVSSKMLDPEFRNESVEGYRYRLQKESDRFKILAEPVRSGSGNPRFTLDSRTGMISATE